MPIFVKFLSAEKSIFAKDIAVTQIFSVLSLSTALSKLEGDYNAMGFLGLIHMATSRCWESCNNVMALPQTSTRFLELFW